MESVEEELSMESSGLSDVISCSDVAESLHAHKNNETEMPPMICFALNKMISSFL